MNRQFANADGTRTADFINCVAWRQTADFIAKYFRKGQNIGLNGTIQTRQYTDRNDKKCTAVEVVINNAYFVESKNSSEKPVTNTANASLADFAAIADSDGDLPF